MTHTVYCFLIVLVLAFLEETSGNSSGSRYLPQGSASDSSLPNSLPGSGESPKDSDYDLIWRDYGSGYPIRILKHKLSSPPKSESEVSLGSSSGPKYRSDPTQKPTYYAASSSPPHSYSSLPNSLPGSGESPTDSDYGSGYPRRVLKHKLSSPPQSLWGSGTLPVSGGRPTQKPTSYASSSYPPQSLWGSGTLPVSGGRPTDYESEGSWGSGTAHKKQKPSSPPKSESEVSWGSPGSKYNSGPTQKPTSYASGSYSPSGSKYNSGGRPTDYESEDSWGSGTGRLKQKPNSKSTTQMSTTSPRSTTNSLSATELDEDSEEADSVNENVEAYKGSGSGTKPSSETEQDENLEENPEIEELESELNELY